MDQATTSVTLSTLDDQVLAAERRAAATAYVDGFADFLLAATFLAISALFAVEWRSAPGGTGDGLSAVGLPVVVLGALIAARALLPAWRERVTYRRVGYVIPRRRAMHLRRGVALVVGAVVAAAIVKLVAVMPAATTVWLVALQGVGVGGMLALVGVGSGAVRFLVLAGCSVVLGFALSALGMDETAASVVLYGLLGLAALFSGAITLARFLRLPMAEV